MPNQNDDTPAVSAMVRKFLSRCNNRRIGSKDIRGEVFFTKVSEKHTISYLDTKDTKAGSFNLGVRPSTFHERRDSSPKFCAGLPETMFGSLPPCHVFFFAVLELSSVVLDELDTHSDGSLLCMLRVTRFVPGSGVQPLFLSGLFCFEREGCR